MIDNTYFKPKVQTDITFYWNRFPTELTHSVIKKSIYFYRYYKWTQHDTVHKIILIEGTTILMISPTRTGYEETTYMSLLNILIALIQAWIIEQKKFLQWIPSDCISLQSFFSCNLRHWSHHFDNSRLGVLGHSVKVSLTTRTLLTGWSWWRHRGGDSYCVSVCFRNIALLIH